MRIKIGDTWISSEDQPVAVELTEDEREQIHKMEGGLRVYAQYPAGGAKQEQILGWMADGSRSPFAGWAWEADG